MSRNVFDLKSDKSGLSTIVNIVVMFLIFLISQLVASVIVDCIYLLTGASLKTLFVILRCALEIGLFCIFMNLYVKKVLKLSMSYFRITKAGFSLLWVVVAFLLPLAVISFYFIFTGGTITYVNSESILLHSAYALRNGLSPGITEELLFRGFIMKLVERKWNRKIAIILPSIIFASLHLISGMDSSDIILLFIAGIAVSVMFSLVTYVNENVWNAVIVHTVWNTLIIGVFYISPQNDIQNMINYTLDNNNTLITGGRFGIESGIPAIIGYAVIIVTALVMLRKKQQGLNTSSRIYIS
jgi:membrane protease YdiL (CAAX protease family)